MIMYHNLRDQRERKSILILDSYITSYCTNIINNLCAKALRYLRELKEKLIKIASQKKSSE